MRGKTGLLWSGAFFFAAALTWSCSSKEAASSLNKISESQTEETAEVIEVTTKAEAEEETEENIIGIEKEPKIELDGISLLFGGDVLLSDHVLNAYNTAGGIGGVLDEDYRSLIAENDFFIVNEEFPFSDRGTKAEDKQFTFRLPPEKVSLFQEMGIDGVTLANNHALDFGQEALLDTISVLDGAGIFHTGAGNNLEEASQPIILEKNDMTVGIIGATRVIPVSGWAAGNNHPGMLATYDPSVLLNKIQELDDQCDQVIVFVHWGIERDEIPQDYQRNLGQQYIDAGADLVVGSHPHVLQGIEYYNEKPIVYSLGNFVFGSSIPRTALLQVQLSGDGQMALKLVPGTSASGYTRMIEDEEKQEFFDYIESISFDVSFQPDGTIQPSYSEG